LDKLYPADNLIDVTGACGLQNSPSDAWETSLFNRLEGCSLQMLPEALNEKNNCCKWDRLRKFNYSIRIRIFVMSYLHTFNKRYKRVEKTFG